MLRLKNYLLTSILLFFSITSVIGQDNNRFPWRPNGKKPTKSNLNVNNLFSFSLGFGTSYGGYGAKINYLFSSDNRIGLQVGAGYYFEDIMYSGAIKFYIWGKLFCDLKYGMFSRKFDLQYDVNYDVDEITIIVTGPGIILGYELDIMGNIGLNAGGGFNYDTKYKQGISYSYDLGLLYRF